MLGHLPQENLRMSNPCFKNNSGSKNSRHVDCRDLPVMWRHSVAAEQRGVMPDLKGEKKIFFWYMSFNSQQKNASWHGCHLEFKNSALWQRIMKLRIWLVDYKLLFWLNKIHMVSVLADWVILVSLSLFFFSWVNWEREREGVVPQLETKEGGRPVWFSHSERAFLQGE